MSLFIAFTIPTSTMVPIRETMRSYQDLLETSIPQEKWHSTMLFLGNTDISPTAQEILTQPIRQSFHPVITVLSLGRGKAEDQLWAYVQEQSFLHAIRKELIRRAKEAGIALQALEEQREFIPHIHTGTLQTSSQNSTIPDMPVKATFSLSELVLLKSTPHASNAYEQLAHIPITP